MRHFRRDDEWQRRIAERFLDPLYEKHCASFLRYRADHPQQLRHVDVDALTRAGALLRIDEKIYRGLRKGGPMEMVSFEAWSKRVGIWKRGWGHPDEPNDSTHLVVCSADLPDVDDTCWQRVKELECYRIPFPPFRDWFWQVVEERGWEWKDNDQDNHSLSCNVPIAEIIAAIPDVRRFIVRLPVNMPPWMGLVSGMSEYRAEDKADAAFAGKIAALWLLPRLDMDRHLFIVASRRQAINAWIERHWPRDADAGLCRHCKRRVALSAKAETLIPFGVKNHIWLHRECSDLYWAGIRLRALEATGWHAVDDMNPEAEAPAKHWRTAARWLKREYWRVFGRDYPPLAIGIHREIIANPKRPAKVTGNLIRKAIYVRSQHDKYLMALIQRDGEGKPCAMRYDLKCKPVGPVAAKDVKAALTTWRERRKRRDADRRDRYAG